MLVQRFQREETVFFRLEMVSQIDIVTVLKAVNILGVVAKIRLIIWHCGNSTALTTQEVFGRGVETHLAQLFESRRDVCFAELDKRRHFGPAFFAKKKKVCLGRCVKKSAPLCGGIELTL